MAKSNKLFILLLIIILLGVLAKVGFHVARKTLKKSTVAHLYDTSSNIKNLKEADSAEGTKVFVASSLDRVFQDGKTLLKPSFSTSADISAAANEYESFQIILQTGKNVFNEVYLTVNDLTDSQKKSSIDKSNISWRKVGYVPTQLPYYPVKYVGNWPDPLLPVGRTSVSSQITQPFWITVYVPAGTPAGDYMSTITVNADGHELKTIPIKLKVYGFELPKSSQLKTAFDFYPYLTKKVYPQKDKEADSAYKSRIDELNDKFNVMMLQYRMNPILNIDPTSQDDLARIDRYLALGLNNFSIGKKGGTFDNNWPKSDEEIEKLLPVYQGYGEDLKLNHMLDFAYIYTWDEGDMGNPVVARISSMIHRAYPGLKNMVCYHGIWNPDDFPNWGKDFDIWCFNIDNFDEAKMRRLQKMGMEMWIYISGPSSNGSPNLALDFDSIDYRISPWLCWKYDIKGLLYWCVNYWPDVDPFTNTKNTKWEQNDNGILFYPGPDGPLASLRIELFRDGMEDYEYIQLLFKDLQILKSKGLDKTNNSLFSDGIRLITIDPTIAQSMESFTKDGDSLKSRRNAIALKIEEIESVIRKNVPTP